MTPKQKQAVRNAVSADHVRFKKDGTVEFKRSYFYRSGATAEGFADRVVASMTKAGFVTSNVNAEDKWAAWPKTSYFVATMKVEVSVE